MSDKKSDFVFQLVISTHGEVKGLYPITESDLHNQKARRALSQALGRLISEEIKKIIEQVVH